VQMLLAKEDSISVFNHSPNAKDQNPSLSGFSSPARGQGSSPPPPGFRHLWRREHKAKRRASKDKQWPRAMRSGALPFRTALKAARRKKSNNLARR